jgi:hypothetical protein
LLLVFTAFVGMISSTFAGDFHHYRVGYTLHGLDQHIIVPAESSFAARQTVQALFPEAIVYSATQR